MKDRTSRGSGKHASNADVWGEREGAERKGARQARVRSPFMGVHGHVAIRLTRGPVGVRGHSTHGWDAGRRNRQGKPRKRVKEGAHKEGCSGTKQALRRFHTWRRLHSGERPRGSLRSSQENPRSRFLPAGTMIGLGLENSHRKQEEDRMDPTSRPREDARTP